MLSWRLTDFLGDAAKISVFWTDAGSHTGRRGKDFLHQAVELSGAMPEAEAWQVCETFGLSPLFSGSPVEVMLSLLTRQREILSFWRRPWRTARGELGRC